MKRRIELVAEREAVGSAPRRLGMSHDALADHDDAVPLVEAELGDQQRFAVVFQAACLLAHLEHAAWRLERPWREARVTPAGGLAVGAATSGRETVLPQARLLGLIAQLFGDDEVAGRGQARRALRLASDRWRQTLAPIDLDRTVQELLDRAPFLWQPAHAVARRALGGSYRMADGESLWIVGPGPARRRMLAAASTFGRLMSLLASDEARARWTGPAEGHRDARALAAAGRHAAAVRVWEQQPLKAASDLEPYADSLFALGSFERAHEALRGVRTIAARLTRIRCLTELGDRGAAEAAVGRLAKKALDAPATVMLAELAVRIHTLTGHADARADWVARALAKGRGAWRARALILKALAAYDAGDADAMDAPLDAAEAAARSDEDAWRLAHARALQALERKDGPGCVAAERRALSVARRGMPRSVAARIWTTMVAGYGLSDDLPAAERAARHALRLFGRCDGTAQATLAWHNLAEALVRRGRFEGVDAIIDIVLRANRRAGNRRGRVKTLSLRMRLALGEGKLADVLRLYADAQRELGDGPEDRSLLRVLAARALAWSGETARARRLIESAAEALAFLEPEERPALLCLVGLEEAAERWAHGTPWADLWRSFTLGRPPSGRAWQALRALEPYRAARLVFDCELAMPGAVPPDQVVGACTVLRGCGALPMAERLEAHGRGPWTVIDRFLDDARDDPTTALAEMLARIGQVSPRIVFIPAGLGATGTGEAMLLIDGDGGGERVDVAVAGGKLEAYVNADSGPLRTALRLFAKLWQPPRDGVGRSSIPASGIIGRSPPLLAALHRLERLSRLSLPLLILGESGTGKELAARHAHRSSHRPNGPFVPLNCAAVTESLLLSELFGHIKGAFTGADRDHRGVFETARGGTVFLDEIGDLPASAQGSLLRVLQESEIRRVGEATSRGVDVRVLAATHRDLEAMVQAGTFREDLYFRLKAATVCLPPLRERGDDLSILAEHVLARLGGERLGRRARARLLQHDWPGNVRELQNVLEVAASLADGGMIEVEHLDLPADMVSDSPPIDYHAMVLAYRRKLLLDALAATGGNQAEAARRLGLTRQALSYHVKKLDLYEATLLPQG